MNKHFYITLPSDTPVPNVTHTPSNFTIPLPDSINLPTNEHWKVGLAEIFIPNFTKNIVKDTGAFEMYYTIPKTQKRYFRKRTIKPGNYTPQQFVFEINRIIQKQTYRETDEEGKTTIKKCMPNCKFYYSKITKFITVALNSKDTIRIKHQNMRDMLGLDTEFIRAPLSYFSRTPPKPSNFNPLATQYKKFANQVDFALKNNYYFIETNIVKNSQIGNKFAPLLQIINPREMSYQEIIHRKYEHPLYVELKNKTITNVQIQIKNEENDEIKFDKGNTTVTLQFKCFENL